ncbi:MAG: GNAT family N-acetyltransferase [Micromonosporaceae bacterium]|nr:GNAT family N-acetyltransferase [Micromonosporaceae bacterium]
MRAYRPTDHNVCRALWAELTQVQRDLYDDPDLGGVDPGVGFEEYLTRLDLSGMWVAEDSEHGVIGFVGLTLNGRAGEVFPVVVTQRHRSQGVGTALLAHVADQGRNRALRQLVVIPESRNVAAIRCLHAAGYDTLAAVRLRLDLVGPRRETDEMDVHDLRFRY